MDLGNNYFRIAYSTPFSDLGMVVAQEHSDQLDGITRKDPSVCPTHMASRTLFDQYDSRNSRR
jgi:hypothetical protein